MSRQGGGGGGGGMQVPAPIPLVGDHLPWEDRVGNVEVMAGRARDSLPVLAWFGGETTVPVHLAMAGGLGSDGRGKGARDLVERDSLHTDHTRGGL